MEVVAYKRVKSSYATFVDVSKERHVSISSSFIEARNERASKQPKINFYECHHAVKYFCGLSYWKRSVEDDA